MAMTRPIEFLPPRNHVLLTSREVQIMRLIVSGETAKRIGVLLKISKRTVDWHSGRILRKFNTRSMPCAAYKFGLTEYTYMEPAFVIKEGKPSEDILNLLVSGR